MSSSLRQGVKLANLTSQELATISNIPVQVPPPGIIPNFDNPDSNSKTFFIVTSILLVLTILLIVNRFYVKTYIIRKYTTDDCEFVDTFNKKFADTVKSLALLQL